MEFVAGLKFDKRSSFSQLVKTQLVWKFDKGKICALKFKSQNWTKKKFRRHTSKQRHNKRG